MLTLLYTYFVSTRNLVHHPTNHGDSYYNESSFNYTITRLYSTLETLAMRRKYARNDSMKKWRNETTNNHEQRRNNHVQYHHSFDVPIKRNHDQYLHNKHTPMYSYLTLTKFNWMWVVTRFAIDLILAINVYHWFLQLMFTINSCNWCLLRYTDFNPIHSLHRIRQRSIDPTPKSTASLSPSLRPVTQYCPLCTNQHTPHFGNKRCNFY